LFNMINLDDTKDKIPFEANKGQGLCSTKWNGLNFCVITLFLLHKGWLVL
jgi:hypothetical protein